MSYKNIGLIIIIIFCLSGMKSHLISPNKIYRSDTIDLKLVEIDLRKSVINEGLYVIKSDSEYIKLQHIDSNNILRLYAHQPFPKINFERYVLMGGLMFHGGCKNGIFDNRLFYLKKDHKVILKMELIVDGFCPLAHLKHYWVIVKRPAHNISYEILFNEKNNSIWKVPALVPYEK